MATGHVQVPGLLGRRSERAALRRLLDDVRGGQSAVLVLRGEAGVGKTALLRVPGAPARRAAGSPGRQGSSPRWSSPFAGLHQLCAPMLDRLERLPEPQQDALRVALRPVARATPPDRFLVALAALSLLSPRPPRSGRCSASSTTRSGSTGASAQVARRSSRAGCWPSRWRWCSRCASPATSASWRACRSCALGGLGDEDARALLAHGDPGPARRARARPDRRRDARQPARAAGAAARADAGRAGGRLRRCPTPRRWPAASRRASCGGSSRSRPTRGCCCSPRRPSRVGDAALLWRAAERLGIEPDAATPAEAAG